MERSKQDRAAKLDRRSETVDANRKKDMPWETREDRGALSLTRDGSEHRKFHSHFEDLLN